MRILKSLIVFIAAIFFRPLYKAATNLRKHDEEQEDPLEAHYRTDFE